MAFILITQATEADIPQMLPLMRGLAEFEEYLDTFAVNEQVLRRQGFAKQPPDFHCLVARQGEAMVGLLVYYFVPFTASAKPTLFIKELFVVREARGQQVGQRLMQAAAREAVAHGCGAVRWAVADWNKAGQRFYERLGAQPNPVWIDYSLDDPAMRALANSVDPAAT